MPILMVLIVVLAAFAVVRAGFGPTFRYLFAFDLSLLTPRVALEALGLAFFSIGVGLGAMIVYAAYAGREVKLTEVAIVTVVGDTAISFLAGFAIFPIVLAQGLDPSSGPGLMFMTLPLAFAAMPFGTDIRDRIFSAIDRRCSRFGHIAPGNAGCARRAPLWLAPTAGDDPDCDCLFRTRFGDGLFLQYLEGRPSAGDDPGFPPIYDLRCSGLSHVELDAADRRLPVGDHGGLGLAGAAAYRRSPSATIRGHGIALSAALFRPRRDPGDHARFVRLLIGMYHPRPR
jgi:hypothetical protein